MAKELQKPELLPATKGERFAELVSLVTDNYGQTTMFRGWGSIEEENPWSVPI